MMTVKALVRIIFARNAQFAEIEIFGEIGESLGKLRNIYFTTFEKTNDFYRFFRNI